jgi:hypothetical protein
MPVPSRPFVAVSLAILLTSPASFAFSSPLSDEAIREAYFLGQRRDGKMASFLEKYKQHLRQPDSGPYISSVEFLTPFALLVLQSRDRSMGYSAQQAAQDYRGQEESVAINIEVLFTESYGALIQRPTSNRSGSPMGFMLRPSDFWKDIEVEVIVKDKIIKPARFTGEPLYFCGDGCSLVGATLRLEFPAHPFHSDSTTMHVLPPEGPEVWVDFDLTRLR